MLLCALFTSPVTIGSPAAADTPKEVVKNWKPEIKRPKGWTESIRKISEGADKWDLLLDETIGAQVGSTINEIIGRVYRQLKTYVDYTDRKKATSLKDDPICRIAAAEKARQKTLDLTYKRVTGGAARTSAKIFKELSKIVTSAGDKGDASGIVPSAEDVIKKIQQTIFKRMKKHGPLWFRASPGGPCKVEVAMVWLRAKGELKPGALSKYYYIVAGDCGGAPIAYDRKKSKTLFDWTITGTGRIKFYGDVRAPRLDYKTSGPPSVKVRARCKVKKTKISLGPTDAPPPPQPPPTGGKRPPSKPKGKTTELTDPGRTTGGKTDESSDPIMDPGGKKVVLVDPTSKPTDPPPQPPEEPHEDPPGQPPVTGDPPPTSVDLAIKKKHEGTCAKGLKCRFRITITNNGPDTFSGPVTLTDTVSLPPTWLSQQSGMAGCARSGSTISCQTKPVTLFAFQSVSFDLGMRLPITDATKSVKNCIKIAWPGSYLGPSTSPDAVRAVQMALKRRGFHPEPADGKLGAGTLKAITLARKKAGLPPRPGIDQALLNELFGEGANLSGDSNPGNDQACVDVPLKAPEDKIVSHPVDQPANGVDLNGIWQQQTTLKNGKVIIYKYRITHRQDRVTATFVSVPKALVGLETVRCFVGKVFFNGTIKGNELVVKWGSPGLRSCYTQSVEFGMVRNLKISANQITSVSGSGSTVVSGNAYTWNISFVLTRVSAEQPDQAANKSVKTPPRRRQLRR